MSFLTMDDAVYSDGLICVHELNNVALIREVNVETYLASAEKYRFLKAEVDTSEKAALTYGELVREVGLYSVLLTVRSRQAAP